MNSTPNDITAAGYQPDGTPTADQGAPANGGGGQQEANPGGDNQSEQSEENGALNGQDQSDNGQGNPLTALVQSRQKSRDASSAYQAQIAALQQEVATLKASAPGKIEPEEWKNPYDATEQPVDHLRAELEHNRAELNALKTEGRRELEETRNAQALATFEQSVAQEISAAAQQTPELLAAYGHVNSHVTKMYEAQGLKGRQLTDAVRNTMLQSYVNGQTQGLTPVEVTAQMALNTGFGSGAPKKPDPVKRGQRAAQQSVGQTAGSGGGAAAPTAQELSKMSKSQLKADGNAGISRIRAMLKGEIPLE